MRQRGLRGGGPGEWFTGAIVTEGLPPMPLVHDISGSLYTYPLVLRRALLQDARLVSHNSRISADARP